MNRVIVIIFSIVIFSFPNLSNADTPLNTEFDGNELGVAETRALLLSSSLTFGLAMLLLGGEKQGPVMYESINIDLSKEAKTAITESISNLLIDPYSAKYEAIFAVTYKDSDKHEILLVCGLVNAKNRFGAYVGKSPFIMLLLNPHLAEQTYKLELGTQRTAAAVRETCRVNRMPL